MKKITLKENNVILATAHAAKFSDVVMKETSVKPELPKELNNFFIYLSL